MLLRTFQDSADAVSFRREFAGSALAHKVADNTEVAYWRSDGLQKCRKIMEAWARYVELKPSGADVMQLKRKNRVRGELIRAASDAIVSSAKGHLYR